MFNFVSEIVTEKVVWPYLLQFFPSLNRSSKGKTFLLLDLFHTIIVVVVAVVLVINF